MSLAIREKAERASVEERSVFAAAHRGRSRSVRRVSGMKLSVPFRLIAYLSIIYDTNLAALLCWESPLLPPSLLF